MRAQARAYGVQENLNEGEVSGEACCLERVGLHVHAAGVAGLLEVRVAGDGVAVDAVGVQHVGGTVGDGCQERYELAAYLVVVAAVGEVHRLGGISRGGLCAESALAHRHVLCGERHVVEHVRPANGGVVHRMEELADTGAADAMCLLAEDSVQLAYQRLSLLVGLCLLKLALLLDLKRDLLAGVQPEERAAGAAGSDHLLLDSSDDAVLVHLAEVLAVLGIVARNLMGGELN